MGSAPKLYLKPQWFTIYDPTDSLSLNIIQYISDEIDACDEEVVSMKDYCTKPAELNGIKDLALMKRINLIRTTPFNQLPDQIQIDLRNAFKLQKSECIDLRSERIKALELANGRLCIRKKEKESEKSKCSSPPTNDASSDWIFGSEPNQSEIIEKLKAQQNEKVAEKKKQKSVSLEEGEIQDDEAENAHVNKRKRKRKNKPFSNKNSSKNFMTKTHEQQELRRIEDEYHCGYEAYKFVKCKKMRSTKCADEDGDDYYQNWCTQKFIFDGGKCVSVKPKYEKLDESRKSEFVFRIPTPNYMPTGNTPNDPHSGCSPITPGYGISPMNASGVAITPQSQVGDDGGDEYWKR